MYLQISCATAHPRNWSVGTQTFWVMLGVSLLLVWLGSMALTRVMYDNQFQQLQDEIDKRTQLFSSTLLDALISEDTPVLETALQGLVELHPNLVGAGFCDYRNEPLLSWGSNVPDCKTELNQLVWNSATILTSYRQIRFEGERFGAIALRWDLSLQFIKLKRQVEQFVFSMIVAVLFLALVLFVLVRFMVVRPIRKVDHYLREVESNEVSERTGSYSSKELIHLCEGVKSLLESMAAESRLRDEREQLLATLEEKVIERTQALKQRNEQLSSIMENMGDALFVTDLEGNILISNPVAAKFFELEQGDAPLQFQQLFPGPHWEKIEAGLQSVQLVTESLLFSDQTHNKTFYEITFSPLPDQQRLILVRDSTQQHDLEEKEQLLAFQSGIAEMSANIMHNIGNILVRLNGHVLKMRSSNQTLEKIPQILEHLSGDVPVPDVKRDQVVAQSCRLIRHISEEELEPQLSALERGVEDVANIVRLQKSHVKPIFQWGYFHAYSFIKDLLTVSKHQLQQLDIQVDIEVDKTLSELYLPRNQLFQALVGVVQNSVEAIGEGETEQGMIEVALFPEKRNAVEGVTFSITDNGVGVEPDRLQELFTFGFTTKKDRHGEGLHATANFVKSFGGEIALSSDGVGKGATVILWFPLRSDENDAKGE